MKLALLLCVAFGAMLAMMNALDDSKQVVFENKSGSKVELWSDNPSEVFYKATLEDAESVTLKCNVGDPYYFTPLHSGGSHEHSLYKKVIRSHTQSVVLHPKGKMKDVAKTADAGCDEQGKCQVVIENRSGQSLNVYWDGGQKEGVLQGSVNHKRDMTLYTHVGHKFYATPLSNDNERLYDIVIATSSKVIKLDGTNLNKKEL